MEYPSSSPLRRKSTYCDNNFAIYTNIKCLCCTSETNIMLYFNYISKIKFKKRKINTPHVWSEVKLKSLSHVWLFATPWTPWNSPSQNTGVGSHSLLKGIFPTQGSNPGFPHCRQIMYQLSHQGSSLFPRVCSNSCPLSQWCHPTISSSFAPSSCPPFFAASASFPMSQLFTSGG